MAYYFTPISQHIRMYSHSLWSAKLTFGTATNTKTYHPNGRKNRWHHISSSLWKLDDLTRYKRPKHSKKETYKVAQWCSHWQCHKCWAKAGTVQPSITIPLSIMKKSKAAKQRSPCRQQANSGQQQNNGMIAAVDFLKQKCAYLIVPSTLLSSCSRAQEGCTHMKKKQKALAIGGMVACITQATFFRPEKRIFNWNLWNQYRQHKAQGFSSLLISLAKLNNLLGYKEIHIHHSQAASWQTASPAWQTLPWYHSEYLSASQRQRKQRKKQRTKESRQTRGDKSKS